MAAERDELAENSDALRAQAAADLLGAHVETIRRLARRGEIPSYKIGKDWRFRRGALLRWADTHHLRRRQPRILVVDDERAIRETFRRSLEGQGWRVAAAADVEAALGYVAQEMPDLVILDLKMPGMNGVEFLKRFREASPDAPVIVVTGYPDSGMMAEAMRYGPVMLLGKPVEEPQLLRAVHVVLNGALDNQQIG